MKLALALYFILTTSISFSSIDGLPFQDPVVENLRKRFEQAEMPTEELLLHSKFYCKEFVAAENDFRIFMSTTPVIFTERNDLIQINNIGAKFHKLHLILNGYELIGTGAKDFTGKNKNGKVVYNQNKQAFGLAIRAEPNNTLLMEWSHSPFYRGSYDKGMKLVPLSSLNKYQLKVLSYIICTPF